MSAIFVMWNVKLSGGNQSKEGKNNCSQQSSRSVGFGGAQSSEIEIEIDVACRWEDRISQSDE